MTYSLSNNCTKNYYNRTLAVQVTVEDVVTWIFLRHSVEDVTKTILVFLWVHKVKGLLYGLDSTPSQSNQGSIEAILECKGLNN